MEMQQVALLPHIFRVPHSIPSYTRFPCVHLGFLQALQSMHGVLVGEWAEIPTAIHQTLMDTVPLVENMEAGVIAKGKQLNINSHGFWNRMLTTQVSTYF